MWANKRRRSNRKKNLQSEQKMDENPEEVQIKKESIDPDIENLLEVAAKLHTNDDLGMVSSSTDNQPVNMQPSDDFIDTTESQESVEYCSPDSTQLLGINDPSALNKEQKSELLSCDAVVQNEQLPFPCESSRFEVGTSSDEANEDVNAFEIEGKCVFDIDGQETILAKSDIKPSSETIGIIGCGPMAKAIIGYLINSKHIVFAYNRTKEKLMELSANITIVSSPAALVEKCNIILTCISDAAAVENIMQGPGGILKGLELNPDKAYVEMSSVDPKTISKYAEEINGKGGRYLAAPIGRTRPAIYLGCALVSASGDLNTFMRCQSCFAAFSSHVVYLSSNVEEAPVCNIINSVVEGISVITQADLLLALEKTELPRSFLIDMLEFQPGTLPLLRAMATNMLENRDLVFLPLKHVFKNILMALEIKKSSFGNVYLVTALNICKEVLCHYPEAMDHDISCVYKLRSDYSEEG